MRNRFALVGRVFAGVVLAAACQDATRPVPTAGSAGSSDDTPCVGTLTGGVYDNVVVPPGGICILQFAQVKGNVKALQNSALVTFSNTIGGSIQGDGARNMNLFADRVEGNIEIIESPANVLFQDHSVCGATLPQGNIHVIKSRGRIFVGGETLLGCSPNTLVKGNIKVEDNIINAPDRLFVSNNNVSTGGNVQVYKNTGSGGKFVQLNTVRESVQCFDNTPPFVGGPNAAQQAQGQCF